MRRLLYAFIVFRAICIYILISFQEKETGVFEALKPLLGRSPYQFDRNEAVSFYLESECEVKKWRAQILSDTYDDVALRLGTECTSLDSALFAQSIANWLLVLHAQLCLATLYTIPGLRIAAIADVDHDSLERTFAFTAIAPYFDSVFTSDKCGAYKPDPFSRDPQAITMCSVSRANIPAPCRAACSWTWSPPKSSVFPRVWMQYQQSLAENVHPSGGGKHALNFAGLGDLASTFFALNVPSTHPQDPREGTWEGPSHPPLDAWGYPQDTRRFGGPVNI